MRRALELAELGVGYANPNPLVGAVIVKDGAIIAEAFHERFGEAHAEAAALAKAGDRAQGAELYVNWEPCVAYPGKRTPPCADHIISAGIKKVIVAAKDPTPGVSGKGIEQLRNAGIEVEYGVLEHEAQKLNEIRTKFATTGKPFILLKMAMTADGKIATHSRDSRWISSEESLVFAHQLRARYAAVLVGIGTAISDDPQLTVRNVEGRDPMRLVVDSGGKISQDARLLSQNSESLTVISTCSMSDEKEQLLLNLDTPTEIQVWRLPANSNGKVDPIALVQKLGESGIDSLFIEGGSEIAASFLENRLIDKIRFVIAPKLIGGREALSPIGGKGFEKMSSAIELRDVSTSMCGPDVVYEAYPHYINRDS